MSYKTLVRQHGRFLGFGLSLTFLSSFGQTFFIALFNDSIRQEFGLSHSAIGGYYSLATLASGLSIIWLGRAVDRIDLRAFTALLCALLAVAAFAMAWVPRGLLIIGAFFLLRLTGQGLLSHTALTTMSRYFDETRGKAMSIAGLGYPIGEAILPALAVVLTGAFGWRMVWIGIGAFSLAVALPVTQLLLRGHADRHERHLASVGISVTSISSGSGQASRGGSPRSPRQWSLGEVLRGWLFWLMLPVVVAPGFIVTGFFFHQNHLVETKGWSAEWFATSFAVFAAGQLAVGLAAGPLVDRFSGARLLSYFTLPLAVALALLGSSNSPFIAAAFMLGLGVTAGLAPAVVGSMWAELYGVQHLGAIRSMATSVMVFGTAASPALMGSLIDQGVSMEGMAWASAAYVVLASTLAMGAVSRQL